jgi:hypothetical protein
MSPWLSTRRTPTWRSSSAWHWPSSPILATAVIAVIAAWVSYWHMVGVAAHYGETGTGTAYLLPISVDGLVVVASISLVEISGRIHTFQTGAPLDISHKPPPTIKQQQLAPTPTAGPAAAEPPPSTATTPAASSPAQPSAVSAEQDHTAPADRDPDEQPSVDEDRGSETNPEPATASSTTLTGQRARGPAGPRDNIGADNAHNDAIMRSDTTAAVAHWYQRDPKMHPAQIATMIGRSERTVRRYWPPTPRPTDDRNTSHPADRLHVS